MDFLQRTKITPLTALKRGIEKKLWSKNSTTYFGCSTVCFNFQEYYHLEKPRELEVPNLKGLQPCKVFMLGKLPSWITKRELNRCRQENWLRDCKIHSKVGQANKSFWKGPKPLNHYRPYPIKDIIIVSFWLKLETSTVLIKANLWIQ
jgi:hypothetical protein